MKPSCTSRVYLPSELLWMLADLAEPSKNKQHNTKTQKTQISKKRKLHQMLLLNLNNLPAVLPLLQGHSLLQLSAHPLLSVISLSEARKYLLCGSPSVKYSLLVPLIGV